MTHQLIHEIHLYAKNPALTIVNRGFHAIFASCPPRYRAKYLLACWHEDYCYGFEPYPVRDPAPPHMPREQTDRRPRPELRWNSRFLPVLPTADFPHPLARSFQRSADHFVLDYCLRFPICDVRVLDAAEDLIRHRDEFGNIRLTTGLWRRQQDQRLYSFDQLASIGALEEERPGTNQRLIWTVPDHLSCNELPKRLFQGLALPTTGPTDDNSTLSMLDPMLVRHLKTFGPGPYPPPPKLMLLLSLFAQHVSTTAESTLSTLHLVNSFEGLPLVKAVFAQSLFLTNFLLALGAEPSRKSNLALYVAIRAGWIEGLRSMVERDETKIESWKSALDAIHLWFLEKEGFGGQRRVCNDDEPVEACTTQTSNTIPDESRATSNMGTSTSASSNSNKKRRRLLDRARLEEKMIFEAVRYEKWDVANWIQGKGIVPDIVTIRLVEAKLADGRGPPSASASAPSSASRPRSKPSSMPVSRGRDDNHRTKARPKPSASPSQGNLSSSF